MLLTYQLQSLDNRLLTVKSDPLHTHGYCLGNGVWSAAEQLLSFLGRYPAGLWHRKRVLELGAGVGVVGQALAQAGADVVLTDLAAGLPLLRLNVHCNFQLTGCRPEVAELDWSCDLAEHPLAPSNRRFDAIVASDVAYDYHLYAPLVQTLCTYIHHDPCILVLLALPERRETREFFPMAHAAGLTWRVLHRLTAAHLDHPISVYQLSQLHQLGSSSQPHMAAAKPRQLFVCDFDWSLIEENSDTFVVKELGAWEAFCRLKATQLPWTQLMDAALGAAHAEHHATAASIRAACARTPLHQAMHEVVLAAAGAAHCDLAIVSDANTVFIHEILSAHQLTECFREVHTNPAVFNGEGALRVQPYHGEPPGCKHCPPNLCKGQVLEKLLLEQTYSRVVYLGDGGGDFCPCTRLGPDDVILARTAYPDGSACSLLRLLTAQAATVDTEQAGRLLATKVEAPLADHFAPQQCNDPSQVAGACVMQLGHQMRVLQPQALTGGRMWRSRESGCA
ncbi:hypothetical protein WJX72_011889 [[Myrmecia] bisecta]|uniref:Uncharacterized protein n=1 Tax=[Myrmecia] bisecta TaxID=41462 RepID=A0AAW1PYZ3_9CHLO